jgi:hypothetical protein
MSAIDYKFLQSEGSIPAFLTIFWAKSLYQGSCICDRELADLLRTLIVMTRSSLISSYYTVEEVTAFLYRDYLGNLRHPLERDNRQNVSQFAFALICMLAKRNWKQTVKSYWSDVSKVRRHKVRIADASEFAQFPASSAVDEDHAVAIPESWDGLLSKISRTATPLLPYPLRSDVSLCVLFLIFFPVRATEELVLWIDSMLCETWHVSRRVAS